LDPRSRRPRREKRDFLRAVAPKICEVEMLGYFLNLMIVATLILFGSGGFLVYDSVSHGGLSQFPEVIGGAALLALGLILLYPQVRFAIKMHVWRIEQDRHS